jgi:zinc-ribbon family
LLLVIWGLRVVYRTIARGVFFCRKCGGDREYRRRTGRRYVTLFFVPLIPLNKTGEHVQCTRCKTRYVTEVLRVPTAARMQKALPAGTRALVTTMLLAGDPANPAARRKALEAVTAAGASDYDDAALDADLSAPADAGRKAIAALGDQLQVHAREWYLAEVIRIAMADGPLTGAERAAAESLAAGLGLTQAQTIGVITLTEQGAGQN